MPRFSREDIESHIKAMKILLALFIACFVVTTAIAADIQAAPIFQIRLVADSYSAANEPLSLVTKKNSHTKNLIIFVEKTVLLDQTALESASVNKDSLGHPVIDVTFTKKGAEQLARVTEENLHRSLAIVIDGRVVSASITGGKVQISGIFTEQEASDLANRINASAKK